MEPEFPPPAPQGPDWARVPLLAVLGGCHLLFIPYILLGWLVPDRTWLIVHLISLPMIVLQWRLNDNVCVLNNLESWLRTGRWRDQSDPAQGAWVLSLIARLTGLTLPAWFMDAIIYVLMAVSWLLSMRHLARLDAGIAA